MTIDPRNEEALIVNFTKNNPDSYTSVILIKSVLFWLMSTLACMTVLTHITQVFGISFKIYAYMGLFLMLGMSLLTWSFFQGQYGKVVRHDLETLSFLVVMGIGGAFIASFFNTGAYKVNPDLFYYVPNAVYHLQNPDLPMDFTIHFLEAGSKPFSSYFGATSLPFEYTQAVVAYFLQVDYLSVFFIFFSALLGFSIPLALFYLICQFVNPKSAAVGTLFTIAIILLLGETPRTPGTWSFPNIHIGKIFFVSIGVPLFAAATISFFRTSSRFDWVLVFAVATALVGATSSSMAILPVLTTVLVIACAAVSIRDYKEFIKKSLVYLPSLSYVIVYTITIFLNFHTDVSANSPVNIDFPVTFLGHAGFFYETSGPATPLALISATIIAVLMTSGMVRKFVLAWIAATIILFLNPIVAPFLIKYLTTPNIYWRLFYVYPFPLLLGLTGAKLFEYTERFSKPARLALISGTACLLFISHFVPFTTSVLYLRTEFAWPGKKLQAFQKRAAEVIAAAPPGPMLAPMPLNGVITMLSGNYPQMRVFHEADRAWFGERGMDSEIDKRICASEFVNDGKPGCLSQFQALLEYDNLRSVVIAKGVALDPQVQDGLNDNGFINYREVDDLLVYWK